MDLPYHPIDTLRSDGIATIELIGAADPERHVSGCPGWTVLDLGRHLGEVWHFWGEVVSRGIDDRRLLREIDIEGTVSFEGQELIDWMGATHSSLVAALVATKLDQEVWTWTGRNQPVSWVHRRMAQEAAVHRFDAARTTGDSYEVPTAIAADGIDEFLTWFAGRERREGEMKPGGTVHLHCTDTTSADVAGGEWFIASLKEPSCTFTREHRKGDAAIRGRAHDLLMWVWRRSTDGVEVIGKDTVARRFRAYTDLD